MTAMQLRHEASLPRGEKHLLHCRSFDSYTTRSAIQVGVEQKTASSSLGETQNGLRILFFDGLPARLKDTADGTLRDCASGVCRVLHIRHHDGQRPGAEWNRGTQEERGQHQFFSWHKIDGSFFLRFCFTCNPPVPPHAPVQSRDESLQECAPSP